MKLGASTLSRNAGSEKMRCVSALSLSTMARGVPWREQPVPGAGLVARQPAFRQRRHARETFDARGAAEAEHLELTGLPGLRNKTDADDHHLDMARDRVGQRRRRAAIVNGVNLAPVMLSMSTMLRWPLVPIPKVP